MCNQSHSTFAFYSYTSLFSDRACKKDVPVVLFSWFFVGREELCVQYNVCHTHTRSICNKDNNITFFRRRIFFLERSTNVDIFFFKETKSLLLLLLYFPFEKNISFPYEYPFSFDFFQVVQTELVYVFFSASPPTPRRKTHVVRN